VLKKLFGGSRTVTTTPDQPDIFSLLTRRGWTAPAATRPSIAVAAANKAGQNSTLAPIALRTLDDEEIRVDVVPFFARDPYPIPAESDRELYCKNDDAGFWISGLRDFLKVKTAMERHGRQNGLQTPGRFLDFGCASGRLLRHVACQTEGVEGWGCDILQTNVDWIIEHLPPTIRVFRNTIYPHLPVPDATFDAISAFSVFTHIDVFEDLWLLELRRVLRPGGIACITMHSERSWQRVQHHPTVLGDMLKCRAESGDFEVNQQLFERPMPFDRIVLSWPGENTYRRNVFHSMKYVNDRWGRWFTVCKIYDGGMDGFQDLVVLRRD
jgi:SAM-dependent methyltransferase